MMFSDDSAHYAYWKFLKTVKEQFRFCRTEAANALIRELVDYAQDDEQTMLAAAGTELWRAQIGSVNRGYVEGGVEIDVLPYAFEVKRMRPHRDYVGDGRANPAGVAYLYAASDKDTAVSEVRPWRGGHVSLSRLVTRQDLYLVDFTVYDEADFAYHEDSSSDKRRQVLWGLFDEEFAKPVDPNGKKLEYVPTQIIAEALRIDGFDGIRYRSSLGPGYNVLIFDLDTVAIEDPVLCRVDKIEYKFFEYPHRGYADGADPVDGSSQSNG